MSESAMKPEKDSIPFYPDHVRTEFKVVVVLSVIVIGLGILGLLLPLGLGDPADPLNTPTHVKPEWYFLALYQMLKYVPKTAGVVAPVLAVGVLALWPFIDRMPDPSKRAAKIRFIVVAVTVVTMIVLTIWGEVS